MLNGRFVASSPAFLRKAAAERRGADLTRQIAHRQFNEAFGVGMACTKAVLDEGRLTQPWLPDWLDQFYSLPARLKA
jgi:hypothetical protein